MAPETDKAPRAWWEDRRVLAALVLVSAVPLLWPDVPPLVDLLGHMGRYRLQLDLAASPALQRFFGFDWALIGNLGVDLLVVPLSELVGLELAVKLIVLSIPPLTVAGFLLVAREVHGRVPPTALWALPLAFNFPLMFGFVNFALSMALAFLSFALWLRLGRGGRLRLRAALFVPLSLLLWVTHVFGWATLGLLVLCAELSKEGEQGLVHRVWRGALACLPLAPPVLLMLAWRSGDVGGETSDWFNFEAKLQWFAMTFRDRWQAFDIASLGVLLFLAIWGWRNRKLGPAPPLAWAAGALLLVFLLLPRILLGSAYADMRLAPFVVAVAVLAIRAPRDRSLAQFLAVAGAAFLVARTAGTTASFLLYDRSYDRELAALDHVPAGARVAAFVGKSCREEWAQGRRDHLPALAIVRRRAFANDQWEMPGAQALRIHYPAAGRFAADPSQLVTPAPCHPIWWTLDRSLAALPRGAFDYVWLISPPPYDGRHTSGLRPVWRRGTSVLFAVER